MSNDTTIMFNRMVSVSRRHPESSLLDQSSYCNRVWVMKVLRWMALSWLLVSGASSIVAEDDLFDRPLRHIFVPLEDFDAIMARDRHGVLLKRNEFEALVKKVAQERKTENRPAGVIVSSANYVAKIVDDQLVLTASIGFTHFDHAWSEIQIPANGLSVEKCLINGQPALAGWHGEQPDVLRVFTDLQGAGTLTLELSARLTAVGSDQATAFGIVPAASGELVVSLPAGKFLQESHSELPRSTPADQPAEYRVALGGHRQVDLQITNRQSSTRSDVLTLANTAVALTVAPGEVSWNANSTLHVVGRPVDRVVCSIPKTLEMTSIESLGLDSWQLSEIPDDPTQTSITLAFRQPFEGGRDIQFRGVLKATSNMAWEVPALVFHETASQVGMAEVRFPPGVRLRVGELNGVRAIIPDSNVTENGDSLLHFQIWKPRFKLPIITEPKSREVRAAATYLLDLNRAGLDFSAVVNFQTRLAPLFDAQINLPAEWQVRSVFVGNQVVPWQIVPQQAGTNQVQILFPTPIPADGTENITVNAALEPTGWPVTDQALNVMLPQVELPQASIVEGLYGITALDEYEVVPAQVTGLDSPTPVELQQLRTKVTDLQRDLRHAFSLQDSRFSGQLQLLRKPARISSQSATFFRIERDTLASHIESRVQIEGGGTRQLVVDLPESAGTDLRFAISPTELSEPVANTGGQQGGIQSWIVPHIIEQSAEITQQGTRRWTLKLDRYALRECRLSVDIRQPRPATGPFLCPSLAVIGAERESGFIAIEASQEQYLSPLATDSSGQPLIKIDPIDFPSTVYEARVPIVAGYRYYRSGWTVAVSEKRFDRSSVPTAIGHSAHHQSVLGSNGEVQHQTEIEFTAVGVQNLKVKLPDGVSLWSVQLDHRPQEIRQHGDGLLVSVPQDSQTEQKHTLTLIYRSSAAEIKQRAFRQTPPTFTALDGQGTEQSMIILKQAWTLHYPDTLHLIDSPGAFQPTVDLDQEGRLARWSSLLRSPNPKHLRDTVVITASVFLLLWGLGKTIDRFGWWRSIAGGILAGLTFLMFSITSLYEWRDTSKSEPGITMQSSTPPYSYGRSSIPLPTMPMSEPSNDAVWRDAGVVGGEQLQSGMAGNGVLPVAPPVVEAAPEAAATPAIDDAPAAKERDETTTDPQAVNGVANESLEQSFEKKDDAKPMSEQGREEKREQSEVLQSMVETPQPDIVSNTPQRSVDFSDKEQGPVPSENFGGLPASLAPGQSAPKTPQSAQPTKLGGLLSLALALTPPEDTIAREFAFMGRESSDSDLHVKFSSRDQSLSMVSFVCATVVVCFWFLRNLSLRVRSSLIATLIVGSIAIAPLLPNVCQPLVDGLFYGGCVVFSIMIFARGLCLACRRCCSVAASPRTMTVTPGLALIFALSASACSHADEAAPSGEVPAAAPHVVWPYSGDDPSTADRVYLPQELFRQLWTKAHPEEAPQPPSPVDGMIVEALHAATFEQTGESAIVHVKSRFVAINLRQTQISVTLPVQAVALKSATSNGMSAVLQAVGSGYQAVLAHPGLHILDVEFDLPATTEGPAGQFTLPTLPTAAGKLSVQLPKIMGDRDLRVNGATGAYRIQDSGNGPVLETSIDRGGDMVVSWRPRAVRGSGNTIVQVDTGEAIVVDDLGLHVNHHFHYRVRQGALTEVVFESTPTMTIREISGPDVGGWQLDDAQGTTRRLRVFLRRTVEDQTQILIDLYSPLDVSDALQSIPISDLIPTDATREIGQVGLFAGPEFHLRATDVRGATQIDVGQFQPVAVPHRPEIAPLTAYRFAVRPASLSITVSRQQPESKCVAEHAVEIGPRKQSWASRIEYELTGAPRPNLSIDLPPGYLLMDVSGSEFITDWYDSPSADGHRLLTVELSQPRLGSVEILLEGVVPRAAESSTLGLYAPQPVSVARLQSSLGVWVNDIYSAIVQSPEGWKATSPDQLSSELRQLKSIPPQFAFRASVAVSQPLAIELSRQTAQLSTDLVILTAVSDESVDYGLTFRWKINRASVDTFQFTTPGWLKGRLELNVPGVRKIDATVAESGETLWTIQLIDPVRGQFLCTGVVSLPLPQEDVVQLPGIRFLDPAHQEKTTVLESQRQCAIMVNRSSGQLVSVDDRLVTKLPVDQLPLNVNSNLLQQALAVVELSSQQPLPKWKVVRSAVQETGRATVTGSDLETSIAWDGTWRTRAVYTTRNRGQQFLGLRLPKESQLLSVFVKGIPSRTVTTQLKDETIHLVPLPQTSEVDLSFEVQITLAGMLEAPLKRHSHLIGQEINLPAPEVVTRQQSEDFGLTVAHTSWRVFVPDQLDVTLVGNSQSNMESLTGDDQLASSAIQRSSRIKADVEDLVRVLNDSRSDNHRKAQSLQNLKQLESKVRSQQSLFSQQGGNIDNSSILYDQVKTLNDTLLKEVTRGTDVQFNTPSEQSGPFANGRATGSTDNRAFIITNNGLNFEGNSVSGQHTLRGDDVVFRFQQRGLVADSKKLNENIKPGKASGGRGALRRSLKAQSYSNSVNFGLENNRSNLEMPSSNMDQLQSNQATGRQLARDMDRSTRMQWDRQSGQQEQTHANFDAVQAPHGQSLATSELGAVPATAWSTPGGVSLSFEFPQAGSETVYSKIGGEPRLTLSLRPRQTWTRALTWLWSGCWGVLTVWLVQRFWSASSAASLRPVFALTALLGALGFVLLEGSLSALGLVIFVVSLVAVFLVRTRQVNS